MQAEIIQLNKLLKTQAFAEVKIKVLEDTYCNRFIYIQDKVEE